jgi:hypothetical protein
MRLRLTVGARSSPSAATKRQDQVLHQQLARDAAARGSQRKPQGQFAAAGESTGETQIRHVQTRKKKDDPGGRKQDKERLLQAATQV